jgi:hypothetical protein
MLCPVGTLSRGALTPVRLGLLHPRGWLAATRGPASPGRSAGRQTRGRQTLRLSGFLGFRASSRPRSPRPGRRPSDTAPSSPSRSRAPREGGCASCTTRLDDRPEVAVGHGVAHEAPQPLELVGSSTLAVSWTLYRAGARASIDGGRAARGRGATASGRSSPVACTGPSGALTSSDPTTPARPPAAPRRKRARPPRPGATWTYRAVLQLTEIPSPLPVSTVVV